MKTRFFDTYCRLSESALGKFLQEYEIQYEPMEEIGKCYSCNEGTYFKEVNIGYHVCSEECLAELDKQLTETFNQLSTVDKNSLQDKEGNSIVDIKYGKMESGRMYQSAVIIQDKEGNKRLFCDFGDEFLKKALAISDGDII